MAPRWCIGKGREQVCTAQSTAERPLRLRRVGHNIEPAIGNLIEPVARVEAILSLVCKPAYGFPPIAREPLRTENNATIEQVRIHALHHPGALPGKQR